MPAHVTAMGTESGSRCRFVKDDKEHRSEKGTDEVSTLLRGHIFDFRAERTAGDPRLLAHMAYGAF